jgi:ABC-type phosphate transport system permease subunit
MSILELLYKINEHILNPIILLLFAIAFLVSIFGIFQFINSETSDAGRETGKRRIFWGLFGMFIMFSAYGLINLILGTFGITPPDNLGF